LPRPWTPVPPASVSQVTGTLWTTTPALMYLLFLCLFFFLHLNLLDDSASQNIRTRWFSVCDFP
jgi:hypothetical protein